MDFEQVKETARLLQESAGDVFGLMTCIPHTVKGLGLSIDQIKAFGEATPNGEELWLKYTARRDCRATPADYDFKSFVIEVLASTDHPIQQ